MLIEQRSAYERAQDASGSLGHKQPKRLESCRITNVMTRARWRMPISLIFRVNQRARGRVLDGTDHECQRFGWPTQATPRYDHAQSFADGMPTNMANLTSV